MEPNDAFIRRSVDLMLPKFSISADASLKEVLQEMGVTDAFSDAADFSGISQEPMLKVSKVGSGARDLHQLKGQGVI